MSGKMWREIALVVAVLVVATIVITVSGADMAISSRFYIGGHWPIGEQFPWKALYQLEKTPAVIMAFTGLMAFLFSYVTSKRLWWSRWQGAFLVLLLLLGPGLMVNVVFKDHWGRPRPGEIAQFGGTKQYLHPWQKGVEGGGRSFPSGHSSGAFYMTAPYFIYRRKRQRLARGWLAGGLVFGVFMSIARIVQGGHFLSDVLWAWGVVHLTAVALSYLLRLDREDAPSFKG